MEQGLIAIIITLCIIVFSVKTKRCVECMLIGSFVASFFAFGKDFLFKWCEVLQEMLSENVWVFLVCLLFGALISLLKGSKGSFGFSKYLSGVCNSDRKTFFVTYIMGILIFVDDYLNVLSIGASMKRIFDKKKLPRESLAFLLNSTGAPVCVLIPISTWAVFYSSLFAEQDSVKAMGFASPMAAYVKAIPFCFYPWITLTIVALFCAGIVPKAGAMKSAFIRAKEQGLVYSKDSERFNLDVTDDENTEDGDIRLFLIPMGVLVACAVILGDILVSVVIALAVCFALYVPTGKMTSDEYMRYTIEGFGDMLQMLTMLLVTFVLKEVCAYLGMTEYIIEKAQPLLLPEAFPAVVFVLGAVLAFCTGSDWGMSSIITPIVFPLGATIGVNPILIMAAIISGGTFGSHACFYSDATLLASQSSGIDNVEHALSQLPYSLSACGLSVIGFLVAGAVY
ncbi:MAG: hypothetical protein K6F37_04640 [Lachnospiraceae bacterium]|nr:hypothetical protein [Lachnospiraceae bacterium]